jgi:hypothetical protein
MIPHDTAQGRGGSPSYAARIVGRNLFSSDCSDSARRDNALAEDGAWLAAAPVSPAACPPPGNCAEVRIAGLEAIDLKMVSLKMVSLKMVSLKMVGAETAALPLLRRRFRPRDAGRNSKRALSPSRAK